MDLTNREIATLIWFAILIAWAGSKPVFRAALVPLCKVMFARPILTVFTSALVYVALCIFALERIGVWTPENIKTTVIWVVSFAVLTVLDFKRLMEDRLFFRNVLREIVSLTVVLLFLIETYTLSLPAELLIVPLATVLAIVQAIPPKRPEEQKVQRFLGGMLAILGLGYLCYSAYQAVVQWSDFATIATARDFAIPILLSLMFLPFLYWLRLYATYEQVFTGLRFAIPNPKLRRYAQWRAILAYRQNLGFLKRWRRMMMVNQRTTKANIRNAIRELRRIREVEKNPPQIPADEGWSPYAAKEFLASEGFETEDYHHTYDEEWYCASKIVKATAGILAPTLTYYVTGNARAATELLLELDGFNSDDAAAADERFWQCAAILVRSAISTEAAQEIAQAIGDKEVAEVRHAHWHIRLTRESRKGAVGSSYEREFAIRCSPLPTA